MTATRVADKSTELKEDTMKAEYTFTWINDPAHGWLKVPMALIDELGIHNDISMFSYQQLDNAYLEEDCDAGVLVEALLERGIIVGTTEVYQDHLSPIRFMDRFSQG